MSFIDVSGRVSEKYKLLAESVAKQVIELMKFPDSLDVAIEFVSEKEIQRLNREYRNIDRVTDVLSFPSFSLIAGEKLSENNEEFELNRTEEGYVHFGDMAICFKQTKRQANEYGVNVESEIKKLVIHSVLHLMGYDHIKDKDYEVMHAKEVELDKKIGEV